MCEVTDDWQPLPFHVAGGRSNSDVMNQHHQPDHWWRFHRNGGIYNIVVTLVSDNKPLAFHSSTLLQRQSEVIVESPEVQLTQHRQKRLFYLLHLLAMFSILFRGASRVIGSYIMSLLAGRWWCIRQWQTSQTLLARYISYASSGLE